MSLFIILFVSGENEEHEGQLQGHFKDFEEAIQEAKEHIEEGYFEDSDTVHVISAESQFSFKSAYSEVDFQPTGDVWDTSTLDVNQYGVWLN